MVRRGDRPRTAPAHDLRGGVACQNKHEFLMAVQQPSRPVPRSHRGSRHWRIEGPRSTERTILGGYDMGSLEWADIRLVGSVLPLGASAAQSRMVPKMRALQGPTEAADKILSTHILENAAALICGTGRPARFAAWRHSLGSAVPRMRL